MARRHAVFAVLVLAGCAGAQPRPSAEPVRAAPATPWLTGLQPDNVLTYQVRTNDGQVLTARYRVGRLVRRGAGVAALMLPLPDSDYGLPLAAYWLAGDDRALYRLDRPPELADPDFVPLDGQGTVLSDAATVTRWRVPREWEQMANASSGDGWEVEELDMVVDGPVRGDRCAQIRQHAADVPSRLTICGNVGLVAMVRGPEGSMGERWELMGVAEPASTVGAR